MAQSIGIEAFKSKVLCQNHNSRLARADAAALHLTHGLLSFGRQLLTTADPPHDETSKLSGNDIQCWVLKTLLTHVVSGVFTKEERAVAPPTSTALVDLLFDTAPWPSHWGLYVVPKLSAPLTPHALTGRHDLQPIVLANGVLGGGIIWLGGLALGLSLFKPAEHDGGPFDGAYHQPGVIKFEFGFTCKVIELSWREPRYRRTVSYRGTVMPQGDQAFSETDVE